MKLRSIICACMLALSTATMATTISGCDLFINKYNGLVDADEKCNRMWSDYESNLQRRSDMIPQLVSVVRGSAAHEEETLTKVIEARAASTQIKLTSDDLSDPAKVKAFQDAQSQLKGSLSRLMMVQEKYPELKANQAFHDLQTQIEGTENRLLRSREQYNKAVEEYNTELRHVSGAAMTVVLGNKTFHQRVYFKMDVGAEKAPTIDFSKASVSSSDGGK